ncbi:MAG: FAD-dependent oxidoreductase [archaeon]
MKLTNLFTPKYDSKSLLDLIIIGAGPGGMTAAIYAARRKLKFCIISLDVGGQMAWSAEVANYPGTNSITGIQLTQNFQKHLEEYKVQIRQEEVKKIEKKGKLCIVQTNKATYHSKAVIVTSGKKPKKLEVPGEDKLLGKGVNYCATCDAPFYKGKTVAVIGGGNSGLEAATYLSKYTSRVYLIHNGAQLSGVPYLKEKVEKDRKVQIVLNATTKEILGKSLVEALKYEQDAKEKIIKVHGVFVEIGLITKADFVKVKKNKYGEIMLYRKSDRPCENMTATPGIFAAGDVTDVPAKQIIVAAGEGCKALIAAIDYIHRWDKKNGK